MISANDIEEHMEVRSLDGEHVGTVDHLEGSDQIKLTKNDSPDGQHHHLIPLDWVAGDLKSLLIYFSCTSSC